MKKRNLEPFLPITIQRNGTSVTGHYRVEGRLISVSLGLTTKKASLGNTPVESMARLLLREILDWGEEQIPLLQAEDKPSSNN